MLLLEVIAKNNTPFPNSPPISNYFVRNLVNEFICYDFIKLPVFLLVFNNTRVKAVTLRIAYFSNGKISIFQLEKKNLM